MDYSIIYFAEDGPKCLHKITLPDEIRKHHGSSPEIEKFIDYMESPRYVMTVETNINDTFGCFFSISLRKLP